MEPWEVQDRVDLGIKVLNEHFGNQDWAKKIKLTNLYLASSQCCVLGQLFGDFSEGMIQVCPKEIGMTRDLWGIDHGFDSLGEVASEFRALDDAWRAAIKDLRSQL